MSIVLFGKTPAQRAIALIRGQFAAGQAGLWYEFGTFDGLYQDSAGTTPATAVAQPAGLRLDKSGRGNSILQATAGARPTISARVNHLINTEDLSQAEWTKSNITATAGKLIATAVLAYHVTYQTAFATAVVGLTYTSTIELKAAEYGWATAVVGLNGATYGKYINLATGAIGGNFGAAPDSIVVTDAGDGYWRVSASKAATTTATVYGLVYMATADGGGNFTGDGASGIYARKAQIGIGPFVRYQRVNTASDYDVAGFPQFLSFDGTDDGMATAAFAAGTLAADTDGFFLVKRNSAAKGIFADVDATHFFGAFDSAGGAATASTIVGASSTYLVDGAAVPGGTGTTQVQLDTALTVGAWHLLEVHNLDLSAWTALQISLLTGYFVNGNIKDVILLPAQSDANRSVIRKYLGSKVGLSL